VEGGPSATVRVGRKGKGQINVKRIKFKQELGGTERKRMSFFDRTRPFKQQAECSGGPKRLLTHTTKSGNKSQTQGLVSKNSWVT